MVGKSGLLEQLAADALEGQSLEQLRGLRKRLRERKAYLRKRRAGHAAGVRELADLESRGQELERLIAEHNRRVHEEASRDVADDLDGIVLHAKRARTRLALMN
eukprot:6393508-Alexandrium_andersonii.AAC.1